MKNIHARQVTLKIFTQRPKKFIQEKFMRLEKSPPNPQNSSNGPFLKLQTLTICVRWERFNDALQCISKSSEGTKMSANIASLYLITAHNYFLKLPKRNGANHLIVQPDFPVFFFNVNVKESRFTLRVFRLLIIKCLQIIGMRSGSITELTKDWLQGIKFRNFVSTCGGHNLNDLSSKQIENKRRGSDNVL